MQTTKSPSEKRKALRRALQSGPIIRAPGAFLPLVGMEIERQRFEAVYLSGATLSAGLGLPDIGLTTLSEVAEQAEQFVRVTNLPVIADCDTGFGEPMNIARCVETLEARGVAAIQIEDQEAPKRCGHLDGKSLVSTQDMVRRVRTAAEARRDPDTIIIARTDAYALEGLEGAIRRAQAYFEAGADVIFAEALPSREEWRTAVSEIPVPLLANMTEFGKSELLSAKDLESLGVRVVIYPVTLLRLAMKAASQALHHPGTILLQPAKYLKNMARKLPPNVTVHESTAINTAQFGEQEHVFETPSGVIRARKVIICASGYLTRFGFYPNTAIPVFTFASMTRELTEAELRQAGAQETYDMIPSNSFGTTVRRAQNRLFLRNVYSYAKDFRDEVALAQWKAAGADVRGQRVHLDAVIHPR